MNTKRQTIWLVSMLSLMVVLSAYYLFTEDVNKLNTATDKTAQEEIKVNTEQIDPGKGEQAVNGGLASGTAAGSTKEAQGQSTDKAADKTTDKSAGKATDKSGDKAAATDAQVLEQLGQAKSGSDYFADLAYKRNQDFGKKIEELQNILGDTKKSTDEIAKASDQFDSLQTMEAKIENLEDLLGQTYSNAIVLPEDNRYKAVVQVSGKLDAKQAQTIIDMMIKELGVTKDVVSVQYLN